MKPRLRRLVYRSRIAAWPASPDLDSILHSSIWNNARHGVTGVLATCDRYFFQVLEGSPAAIDGLLAKLHQDDRHSDLLILGSWDIDNRLFPGWTMARADLRSLRLQLKDLVAPEQVVKTFKELAMAGLTVVR